MPRLIKRGRQNDGPGNYIYSYILYYRGKIIGGIYDDRLLVKPVMSAKRLMPDAVLEIPYDGAKEMLLVEDVDDREFLSGLVETMYDELPERSKYKSLRDGYKQGYTA